MAYHHRNLGLEMEVINVDDDDDVDDLESKVKVEDLSDNSGNDIKCKVKVEDIIEVSDEETGASFDRNQNKTAYKSYVQEAPDIKPDVRSIKMESDNSELTCTTVQKTKAAPLNSKTAMEQVIRDNNERYARCARKKVPTTESPDFNFECKNTNPTPHFQVSSTYLPDGKFARKPGDIQDEFEYDEAGMDHHKHTSVWTNRFIAEGTVFGPFHTSPTNTNYSTTDFKQKMLQQKATSLKRLSCNSPGKETSTSSDENWMKNLNWASKGNLVASHSKAGVFFVANMDIQPQTELVVSYFSKNKSNSSFSGQISKFDMYMQYKHAEKRKPHTCGYCGRVFARKHNLHLHIKITHENCASYKCDVCGKLLTSKTSMYMHMKSHTGRKRYQFRCDICGHQFMQNKHLMQHQNKHKIYKCDVCAEHFTGKSSFSAHRRQHKEGTYYGRNGIKVEPKSNDGELYSKEQSPVDEQREVFDFSE